MLSKYQEALNNIKKEAGTPYFSSLYDIDDWKEDFKTLQELVDKETPMKPIVSITTFKTRRGKGYQTHNIKRTTCPKCAYDVKESYLGRMMSGNNYCYKCGQKLDWGDTDE